jgi:FMN phosphatase YigB (HAD superfamily)
VGRAALGSYVDNHEPLRLFAEVKETLRALKERYLLGVITNADGLYQRIKLVHLGIAEYFQCIAISQRSGL